MEDSLVDSEGFPRNDIDINQVRLARNRIICKWQYCPYLIIFTFVLHVGLNNDIRDIMKQIEDKLGDYFVPEWCYYPTDI